jgi:predicted enzyme related to lactoylglutathione lyase
MIGIRRLEPEEYNIKEMTLLNEVQLERFTSLQQEIVKHINDDYSGVSMSMTSIQWKGKTVRLYMDTYWSTLVWQDLEAHRDEMCLVKYNMLIKEGQERQYQEQYHEAIHFYEKAFSLGCNTDQQALKEMIESCHQALQNEHNNLVESCNKIHKAAEKHYQTENYEKALKFYELYLSKQCATQSDKEAIQERIASIHSIMDQK